MKIAVYSNRPYDRNHLIEAASGRPFHFEWIESRLDLDTVSSAHGYEAVSVFVNDRVDAEVLKKLAAGGTRLIALRCAGFNNVDLRAAESLGITVVNVPAYSPNAVAEHAIALLLTLVRRTHLAHERVARGDFTLDGLLGFDLNGKTAGLVGTGRIGVIVGRILKGFGCRVLAYDPFPPPEAREAGFGFCALEALLKEADIVSLHCPLLPATRHIINRDTLALLRPAAVLINTSRGGLIDTEAALAALENKRLGGLGLDVYEHEAALFFDDHSDTGITDPLLKRLLALPNTILTGHQAFFTHEALAAIANTTVESLDAFAAGKPCRFALKSKPRTP